MVVAMGWWWSEVAGSGGGLGKKKEKVRDVISIFFGTILSTFGVMTRSSVLFPSSSLNNLDTWAGDQSGVWASSRVKGIGYPNNSARPTSLVSKKKKKKCVITLVLVPFVTHLHDL